LFLTFKKKKALFYQGSYAGEEELLAHYLTNLNANYEHDFLVPTGQQIFLDEGFWEEFVKSSHAKAQEKADRISYVWDNIINTFINHIVGNTLYYGVPLDQGLAHYDKQLSLLAQLSRFHRRIFAKSLLTFLSQPVTSDQNTIVRTIKPTELKDTYYVFLTLKQSPLLAEDEYRKSRMIALEIYCKATKERNPNAQDIIGYATEPGLFTESRSEDLLYFDARVWNPEHDPNWGEIKRSLDIASSGELKRYEIHEDEYPTSKTTRINFEDFHVDFQPRESKQGTTVAAKKSNKKSIKKGNTKLIAKAQKKKKGSRAARVRQRKRNS